MKNPVLTAVLNFFLFAGGTLYLGKRTMTAMLMTVGGSVAQATEIYLSPLGPGAALCPHQWPFLLGGLVVLKIGLAVDGYNEAVEMNAGS